MGDVRTTIDLEGPGLVFRYAVGLERRVPPHLNSALLQVIYEDALDHALVDQKNVGVQHVNYGWVVYLAAQSVERLIGRASPEGNVVNSDASLQQRIGQAHLAEGLDGLGLESICSTWVLANRHSQTWLMCALPSNRGLIGSVVNDLNLDTHTA